MVALALMAPAVAAGEVVEEGTRIAAQGGWRYAPNASFSERARALETPLAREPAGGPSLQLAAGLLLGVSAAADAHLIRRLTGRFPTALCQR